MSWLKVALLLAFIPPLTAAPLTMTEILAQSKPGDWRGLDPNHTLYLDFSSGRVVIELAPTFAPRHGANIKALVREGYFNGLSILRVQDNYVVQWGDPDAGEPTKRKPIKQAERTLKNEFTVPLTKDLPFTRLPDGDGYAPQVGFSNSFPSARNPQTKRAWLTHCYAMVGVGRDTDADSGSGSELYVVIGHAPRHLDRNVTLVGRVVQGIDLLSSLPRGTGPLGFYEKVEQRIPIQRIQVAGDLLPEARVNLEVLRTDTPTFAALVESRRNRPDPWYKNPAGFIELCNVPLPVRTKTN